MSFILVEWCDKWGFSYQVNDVTVVQSHKNIISSATTYEFILFDISLKKECTLTFLLLKLYSDLNSAHVTEFMKTIQNRTLEVTR